jgi:hypothetical protein
VGVVTNAENQTMLFFIPSQKKLLRSYGIEEDKSISRWVAVYFKASKQPVENGVISKNNLGTPRRTENNYRSSNRNISEEEKLFTPPPIPSPPVMPSSQTSSISVPAQQNLLKLISSKLNINLTAEQLISMIEIVKSATQQGTANANVTPQQAPVEYQPRTTSTSFDHTLPPTSLNISQPGPAEKDVVLSPTRSTSSDTYIDIHPTNHVTDTSMKTDNVGACHGANGKSKRTGSASPPKKTSHRSRSHSRRRSVSRSDDELSLSSSSDSSDVSSSESSSDSTSPRRRSTSRSRSRSLSWSRHRGNYGRGRSHSRSPSRSPSPGAYNRQYSPVRGSGGSRIRHSYHSGFIDSANRHVSRGGFDKKHISRPSDNIVTRHLWVGRFAGGIDYNTIYKDFSRYGSLESVNLLRDQRCAFVNFDETRDAVEAKKRLEGSSRYPKIAYQKPANVPPSRREKSRSGDDSDGEIEHRRHEHVLDIIPHEPSPASFSQPPPPSTPNSINPAIDDKRGDLDMDTGED